MKNLQEQVQLFCLHHGLIAPAEHRLLDIQSELGEVCKEVLKGSDYGTKPLEVPADMSEELGDLVFAIMQLASSMNIDLEDAVRAVMVKYEKRIHNTGSAGSGR